MYLVGVLTLRLGRHCYARAALLCLAAEGIDLEQVDRRPCRVILRHTAGYARCTRRWSNVS